MTNKQLSIMGKHVYAHMAAYVKGHNIYQASPAMFLLCLLVFLVAGFLFTHLYDEIKVRKVNSENSIYNRIRHTSVGVSMGYAAGTENHNGASG